MLQRQAFDWIRPDKRMAEADVPASAFGRALGVVLMRTWSAPVTLARRTSSSALAIGIIEPLVQTFPFYFHAPLDVARASHSRLR